MKHHESAEITILTFRSGPLSWGILSPEPFVSFSLFSLNWLVLLCQSVSNKVKEDTYSTCPSEPWLHQQVASEEEEENTYGSLLLATAPLIMPHPPIDGCTGNRGFSVLPTNKQHNRFFPIAFLTCSILYPCLSQKHEKPLFQCKHSTFSCTMLKIHIWYSIS